MHRAPSHVCVRWDLVAGHTPLLLGSWYGLLVLPLIIAGLAPRAVAEERLLRRDLPGYADYT